MTVKADWIAVDWGTTRLRAWAMQNSKAMAEAHSQDGMGQLAPAAFEPTLVDLVADWLGDDPVDVVVCGMAGARQGWAEVAYVPVPAAPLDLMPVRVALSSERMRVFILPGLKQARPADVMRGEETQIAGFLARNTDWDGVLCLPGTHTKWAHVSAGEVVSFQTFMTGELFGLLRSQSVLRHSVGDAWASDAFDAAMDDTLSRPERLAAQLFNIRARDLLENQTAGDAVARLSGALIGAELAATRPYWLGQQVAVIGDRALAGTYRHALGRQGAPAELFDGSEMTLAGLSAAKSRLDGTA